MPNQDWRTDFKGCDAGGDFAGAWTQGNLSGSGSEGFDGASRGFTGLQEGKGVRATHTLSSQCHQAVHNSHCLLKTDILR